MGISFEHHPYNLVLSKDKETWEMARKASSSKQVKYHGNICSIHHQNHQEKQKNFNILLGDDGEA